MLVWGSPCGREMTVSPNAETLTPRLSLPPEDAARGLAFPALPLLRAHFLKQPQGLGVLRNPRERLLEVALGFRVQAGLHVQLSGVAVENRVVAIELDRGLDGLHASAHLADHLHAGEREIVLRLGVPVPALHRKSV